MNWDKVRKNLQAPLSPDAIKPPPRGKFGEYVDALHVIREANRIFGEDGWSYEVTRLEQSHYGVVDLTYNGDTKKQLRCSYLCAVKVNVDGVFREGLAVGVGNGKPENAGDVIESAVKEAETDALKRALRTFGNTFGLALYEKDVNAREVGYTATDDEAKQAIEQLNSCDDLDALKNIFGAIYTNARHVADHVDVVKAKDARKAELQAKLEAEAPPAQGGIPY